MNEPFILGANYWPRRKAMYWWSDFDAGEVREEFATIRDLGLSLVRIFLLWDDFQPTADTVDVARLRDLTTVCDIAGDLSLKLDVTFFTGHMSGPNWAPRWLLGGPPAPGGRQVVSVGRVVADGYANPYTDTAALRSEHLLVDTVVRELRSHPAIGFWNLGNEPDLFALPPDNRTGQGWVHAMTQLIHGLDRTHPVTCGLHTASLLEDNGLRVDQVFAETDFAVMHGYPMYASPWWARSPLDPDMVPFACALTAALSGKPVLMEEFGGCTAGPGQPSDEWSWTAYGQPRRQFMASEEALAEYVAAVLPRLVSAGATGAVLWCFADYVAELWGRPPCDEARHERFFGLIRPDGSLKPHARVLRDFAATHPLVRPPAQRLEPGMTADEFYREPKTHTVALYHQWLGDTID